MLKVFVFALVLRFYVSCFVLKHSRHFSRHLQSLGQSELKPTNHDSLTHVFPRSATITWLLLRFDWFTRLPVSFVTGYFVGFWHYAEIFFFVVLLTRACCCIVTFLNCLRDLFGETTNLFDFGELTCLSLGQYRKTEDRTFEADTYHIIRNLIWPMSFEEEGVTATFMYELCSFKFV